MAALNQPFTMPGHLSERRGSTFFSVSIRVGMAGVMVGLQDLDERVAKNRPILGLENGVHLSVLVTPAYGQAHSSESLPPQIIRH
jgi:hypothetical protein